MDSSSKLNYSTLVHETLSYSNAIGNIALIPYNIPELLENMVKKSPTKVGYIFPHNGQNGIELTFKELQDNVKIVSQNLLKLGLKRGDTIAFSLPNTHELLVLFLSGCTIGLVCLFIEPLNQLLEFEYYLKKTNAKCLIYSDICPLGEKKQYDIVEQLCPEVKTSKDKQIISHKLPMLKHLII